MIDRCSRAAVLPASVALVMALPAAASDAAATVPGSVTIRVLVQPVTRTIKDVNPKTINLVQYTKGDTIRGTSILRNAVPAVRQAKRCSRRYQQLPDLPRWRRRRLRTDGIAKFPGGTVHIHGVSEFDPTPSGADCRGHWHLRGSNRCRRGSTYRRRCHAGHRSHDGSLTRLGTNEHEWAANRSGRLSGPRRPKGA